MTGVWFGALRCENHIREIQLVMIGARDGRVSPGFLVMMPTWREPRSTRIRFAAVTAQTINRKTIVTVVDARTGIIDNGTEFVGNFKDNKSWDYFGMTYGLPGCSDFYMGLSRTQEDIDLINKVRSDYSQYVDLLARNLDRPIDAEHHMRIRQREANARSKSLQYDIPVGKIALSIAAAAILGGLMADGSGTIAAPSNGKAGSDLNIKPQDKPAPEPNFPGNIGGLPLPN